MNDNAFVIVPLLSLFIMENKRVLNLMDFLITCERKEVTTKTKTGRLFSTTMANVRLLSHLLCVLL